MIELTRRFQIIYFTRNHEMSTVPLFSLATMAAILNFRQQPQKLFKINENHDLNVTTTLNERTPLNIYACSILNKHRDS